jgi:hypothetical protein
VGEKEEWRVRRRKELMLQSTLPKKQIGAARYKDTGKHHHAA